MRSWIPVVVLAALARPLHAGPVKLGTYDLAATPCSLDGPAPSLTHVDGGLAVTPDGAIAVGFATGTGGAAYVLGGQRSGDHSHAVVYRVDGLPR